MAKTNHYNVEVKEIILSNSNKVLSETIKESYPRVTKNKLQMLIGKFTIEHPECAAFIRKGCYASVEVWTCDDKNGLVIILACVAKEVAE